MTQSLRAASALIPPTVADLLERQSLPVMPEDDVAIVLGGSCETAAFNALRRLRSHSSLLGDSSEAGGTEWTPG